ncbi:MAG: hypothetical protein M3R48_02950 [Candidatus Dormibacteraeota bacterium]|nr:hypothetical protein [Candidatus Dormibacteraeota bacterium]
MAGYGADTMRKASWIAESLSVDPMPAVELVAPLALTSSELQAVHDRAFVEAVRTGRPLTLAESQGFDWDPGMWVSVSSSNGGAVAAALAALDDGVAGSLSSGLHHARADTGHGYCTFNGLALAARTVLDRRPGRVLIVDLDAHCGGGTASLVADQQRIHQVDVAVDYFDHYAPSPGRIELELVRTAGDYLETVDATLATAAQRGPWELVLYNAGMDPYEGCDVGGLRGITEDLLADRENLVFRWAASHGWPIAFVIAGGYVGSRLSRGTLVRLHRHTLSAAAAVPAPTN